jgi:cupin superfamily acireductone dioxygenase involved in methionine salvage
METEEIQTVEAKAVTEVKETGIVLSDNEKQLIENSRRQMEAVEEFKAAYNELVQRTGFAWVVDGNSPINNPVLGVTRVN